MTRIKRSQTKNLLTERRDTILRKVLIVKDSHLQSKLYGIIFSPYPECELFFAAKGLEAIDIMDMQKDIDLIISDIHIPVM